MRFFYYFLINTETKVKIIYGSEDYMGEPGEEVVINGIKYFIDDYTEEWEDFDEPEDY